MNDITRQPWAEWLENSLRTVVDIEPVCLCIAATAPDGTVFAHNIQSDVTMDIIRENIGKIKEMLEENDDG